MARLERARKQRQFEFWANVIGVLAVFTAISFALVYLLAANLIILGVK